MNREISALRKKVQKQLKRASLLTRTRVLLEFDKAHRDFAAAVRHLRKFLRRQNGGVNQGHKMARQSKESKDLAEYELFLRWYLGIGGHANNYKVWKDYPAPRRSFPVDGGVYNWVTEALVARGNEAIDNDVGAEIRALKANAN